MLHRSLVAACAAALLAFPALASADPFGPQHQLTSDPGSDHSHRPAIAGGLDRSLVVYEHFEDFGEGGWQRRIDGRFLDGAGAPLGPSFPIGDDDTDEQEPDVAYNPARNEFLVVWQVNDEGGGAQAQRVGGDGALLGDRFSLTNDSVDGLAVAGTTTRDEYLVVWSDSGEIDGRAVSGAGQRGDDVLNLTAGEDEAGRGYPDVAHDPTTNRWLVAWEGSDGDDGSDGIFGLMLDESHANIVDGFEIADDSLYRYERPSIASNAPRAGFRVVFSKDRDFSNESLVARAAGRQDFSEIMARDVEGSGTTPGESFQVSTTHENDGFSRTVARPRIVRDPVADEFLVAWQEDLVSSGSDHEILAQRLSAAGGQLGTDDARVSTHEETPAKYAGVAYVRATCSYAVSWRIDLDSTGVEVFSRGFDAPDCPPVTEEAKASEQQTTAAQQQQRLPVRCTSVRRFRVHVRAGKKRRFLRANATVAGTAVKVKPGKVLNVLVDLTGKPVGTFEVKVRGRRNDGRLITSTRRYRTCVPRHLSGKPS